MNKIRVKLKLIIICLVLMIVNQRVEANSFEIWGPGLEPHKITMPARYFFVTSPKNIGDLKVSIEGSNMLNQPCRIWSNILDRKDGSIIVRYKVYEQCKSLKISVKHQTEHIADSPYVINEIVHSDDCFCPDLSLADLKLLWQCGATPPEIDSAFEQFGSSINYDLLRSRIIKQFDRPHSVSLCHYVIKTNKLYRKCYGKHVGFNMFSDSILLSLTRKAKLPDLELFINLGDWPLSGHNLNETFPIFSWCGASDAYDIIMPTYDLTEATLENMGRVMLDMLSVQGNCDRLWEEREEKLFWRGRDSNKHRLELVKLSRKYPELFNVSLTNFFFFREDEDEYGPKSDHVSFFKFFDYKYQLAIDGTVAPYRTPFLLAGASLVLKPQSKYFEYFYKNLIPNVHYLPVEADLSDLVDKLQWAKTHDAEAKAIAENGKQFANKHLLPQNIFCYYFHLVHELNQRTTTKVQVLDGMELISQKSHRCDCSQSTPVNEEL